VCFTKRDSQNRNFEPTNAMYILYKDLQENTYNNHIKSVTKTTYISLQMGVNPVKRLQMCLKITSEKDQNISKLTHLPVGHNLQTLSPTLRKTLSRSRIAPKSFWFFFGGCIPFFFLRCLEDVK